MARVFLGCAGNTQVRVWYKSCLGNAAKRTVNPTQSMHALRSGSSPTARSITATATFALLRYKSKVERVRWEREIQLVRPSRRSAPHRHCPISRFLLLADTGLTLPAAPPTFAAVPRSLDPLVAPFSLTPLAAFPPSKTSQITIRNRRKRIPAYTQPGHHVQWLGCGCHSL